MIATTHPVAEEDVMALLDGELSSAEAHEVSSHFDECAECSELSLQLRRTSQSLSAWTVPAVPTRLEDAASKSVTKAASKRNLTKPEPPKRIGFRTWRPWAVTGAGIAVAALVLVARLAVFNPKPNVNESRVVEQREQLEAAPFARSPRQSRAESRFASLDSLEEPGAPAIPPAPAPPLPQEAPMIAGSVNLTIQVKDVAASRAALDAVLARHHGYAAQLTVNTPENDARSFQASLRIPAPELAAAIAEIRTLGRVEVETQSGEEVTQQHADLVARLQNARETEQRLRDLLTQRTGKIDEVLRVEEAIDRVRGEIESMEADQKTLEHRVDFATIDLQLTEEYKEKLNPQPTSVSGSMRNAFVAGLRHASGALLGIVLFFEEFGPVILIWVAILGAPAVWGWRRYRKARERF
jgi:anti-sigma factor RsiW